MSGLNFNGVISTLFTNNETLDPRVKESSPEDLAQLAKEHLNDKTQSRFAALKDRGILGDRNSFSFANIYAQVLLPFKVSNYAGQSINRSPLATGELAARHWGTVVDLPGLSMISISEHRDVYPVVALGRMGIKGFTTGNILYAGSLGFTVFDENPFLNAIRAYAAWRGDYLGSDHILWTSPSELPPLDLNLIYFGEKKEALATQTIRSLKIVDSAKNVSINDIVLTDTYSFMAASVSNLVSIDSIFRELEATPEPTKISNRKSIPTLKIAPNGNSSYTSGSRPPSTLNVSSVNSLSSSIIGNSINASQWNVGTTQVSSGIYQVVTSAGTTSGNINATGPAGTVFGSGAVLTYNFANNGIWNEGDSFYIRIFGDLTTSVSWATTGTAPSGVDLNTLIFKPNVVVKNPPPGATVYVTIYDSWSRAPHKLIEVDSINVYKDYICVPATAPHYTSVSGDGLTGSSDLWTLRAPTTMIGPLTTPVSGGTFNIPQDYFIAEIGIIANNTHKDTFRTTSIYVENKIELG